MDEITLRTQASYDPVAADYAERFKDELQEILVREPSSEVEVATKRA